MEIDISLLPIVAGNIKYLACEHIWIDENSWRSGYNAIAEMLLMKNGIVEAIDRLYRLTDSVYNGAVYTEQIDGSITPDLPIVPSTPSGMSGLRRQLLDSQGILPSGWPFGFGDKPATVADIVRAMRADTADQVERATTALDALSAAAGGSTIFDVVRGFLMDGASVTAEGGILIALLIGIAGNTAMQRILVDAQFTTRDRLDRLIASLDGGAATRPDGDVLSELKSIDTLLG